MKISRRDIRACIIQSLYEADFNDVPIEQDEFIKIYNRITKHTNPELENNQFAITIIKGIVSHYDNINKIIEEVATNWSMDKIGILDRNILRLGIYEILNGKTLDVPGRVALNEAIELSKMFLNETAKNFINGVLGNVYNEVKDESEEEYSSKKITNQQSVGSLVYYANPETKNIKYILIKDIFNRWSLPKSKLLEKESVKDGAMRVVKDELSITATPSTEIGSNEYISHAPEGSIRKQVKYLIAKTNTLEFTLKHSEGLDEASWFDEEEVKKLKLYSDMKEIIFNGIALIREENKK